MTAQPLGGRQRKTLIGKEEEGCLVLLHERLEILNHLFGLALPEILVIQRQRAECTIFVIAATRKLNRKDGLGRKVLSEVDAVEVRRRQGVNVLGIERLIHDDFTVLPIDEVRDLAEVLLAFQLVHQFQQSGFAFEHDIIVGELKHRIGAAEVVHQPGKDAAADGQMHVGVGLLDQPAEREPRKNLRGGGDRHPDQIGSLRQ